MMKTSQMLVDEALAEVRTVSVADALEMHVQAGVLMVDLREHGELRKHGCIPGAFHVPRGLLEFWFDPTPGMGKPQLTRPDLTYLLFCAAGMRSALAARTLQDMGMTQVCHLAGGFEAWRQMGGPTQAMEEILTR